MIIVRLQGGLGNQFFQYALGRHLSLLHQRPLKLDTSFYTASQPDPILGIRIFGLSPFAIAATPASSAELRPFALYKLKGPFGKLARSLRRGPSYLDRAYIQEPETQFYHFDPALLTATLKPVVCLDGFWQTEKYFAPVADTIRQDLQVREPPAGPNLAMLTQIRNTHSVAIHIRHGDNARRFARTYGVLPLEYYHQALTELSKHVPDLHCFIFSDDIPWAQANLRLPHPAIFVDHNGDEKNYEDMRLMAACKHHIVSNSTFSWWGAWLGQTPEQKVYAPRKYYMGKDYDYHDYYPAHWCLL